MSESIETRRGRKMFEQKSPVIKGILEWDGCDVEEFQISIPKKRQPVLPETVLRRLYGTPGENIFTYGLDKPKPRKKITEQIEVGMVPKEESKKLTRCIMRENKAFRDSLDKSLLPHIGLEIKPMGKTILNKTLISHFKNNMLIEEEETNTKLVPKHDIDCENPTSTD